MREEASCCQDILLRTSSALYCCFPPSALFSSPRLSWGVRFSILLGDGDTKLAPIPLSSRLESTYGKGTFEFGTSDQQPTTSVSNPPIFSPCLKPFVTGLLTLFPEENQERAVESGQLSKSILRFLTEKTSGYTLLPFALAVIYNIAMGNSKFASQHHPGNSD